MSSQAMLSASETVRNSFDFTVDKYRLSGPDNMKTDLFGLFRSDTCELVGRSSVTDTYEPHTTDDVVALVDACESVFGEGVKVEPHFRAGHYVNVTPSGDYRRNIFGTEDNIFPRLIIRAGYDGKSFAATLGYYRDLCNNLSMLRKVSGTTVRICHTRSLRSKMSDLIRTFGTLKNSWATLEGVIQHMESNTVNMVDFLNRVYPLEQDAAERAVVIHRNRTAEIFSRMRNERFISKRGAMPANDVVTGWEAYNAIQGYEQHVGRRSKTATAFDRIMGASGKKEVWEAEKLALSM